MHAFDRQTDGRTDGQTDRNLIVRPRLHSMQRSQNVMETGIKMSIFEKRKREWELLRGNEWEWESITHSLFFKCKQKQRAIEPERRTTSYTTRHVNCRPIAYV